MRRKTGGTGIPRLGRGIRQEVRIIAVPCPACGADAGTPCTSSSGKRTTHESRRRMAVRADAVITNHSPKCARCGRRMRSGVSVVLPHTEPGTDLPCPGRTPG